jgi:MFS family permease
VCSFLYSGWFADKFLMYMTRRKGGIREPEDRLWLLSVNTVLLPAGLILWGVGAANQIHWFGLVIGGVLVGFTCATAGAFTLNYILDSYKDLGGEVVLTSQVIRVSLPPD